MSQEDGSKSGRCREVFARLSEYLDQELDPGPCAEIEGHMEDCAPCRAFLESLRRTVRLVESLERPPLPEEVHRRVRQAYRRLRAEQGDGRSE